MKRHNDQFDMVILGGGAAAFAAAIRADELGFSSAMVNTGLPMGGTCVNVGCVPSKFLLEAGNEYFYRQSPQFACNLSGAPRCNFPEAIANKDRMVHRLRRSNYQDVLEDRKIEYVEGSGTLLPGRIVKTNGRKLKGRHLLLATGSSPKIPPIDGLEEAGYLTNRTLMQRKDRPEEMMVLGGGPLGLEFAQMYAHFGSAVTVLESAERLLPFEEPEVSAEITRCLTSEGIKVHTGARVRRIHREKGRVICDLTNGKGTVPCEADEILVATGVTPNTAGMGLQEIGVELTEKGYVKTQANLETTVAGIWAAGDVVGRAALETVAAKEGATAALNALTKEKRSINYDLVPHAVFTNPQVASVGLTDAEAARRGLACECRVITMERVPKALTVGDTRGVLKMVVESGTQKLLGVHIVSPIAADMIHAAAYALRGGLTVEDIIDTVHTFPTFSEALKMAAESFRHDMSRMSCCIE
ncbi:mercury(II) reductase [mine drainage metagenome]|uniref:Mercuric reductase n=3 Tax=mine drainage metagenome TaxID=410659 RepID=T1D7R1_9ZZZZ